MAGMNRREFGRLLGLGVAAGLTPGMIRGAQAAESLYEFAAYGNVRLLHFTDCHAQLLPIYFREPSVNLGMGGASGRPPHLVGEDASSDRVAVLRAFVAGSGVFAADLERTGPEGFTVRRQVIHVAPGIWLTVDAFAGAQARVVWGTGSDVRIRPATAPGV